MATYGAYGGKFIGNDIVVPRPRQDIAPRMTLPRPVVVATQAPEVEQPIALVQSEGFSQQLIPVRIRRKVNVISKRNVIEAVYLVGIVVGLALAGPHLPSAWHAMRNVSSRVELGAKEEMHPKTGGSNVVLPPNAILVKNGSLSSFIDAIDSQSITINIGSTSVTPQPSDIAKWITQENGPGSGTTILEANIANITAYLNGVSQQYANQASGRDNGTSTVSSAASQLAESILSYNGATVSL